MATKTSNYEFNKPEKNDFYDVDVQNENWDKVDEELSEFDDSGVTEDIKSFPDFLSKFVTGNKVAITLRNLKAGLQFVLHAGQIVNNCVTDNAGLPLSAAQGKALMDKYTQLYSDLNTTNNNLSNIRVNFKKRDATTVQLEAYTEGNVDGINIQATKDKKFYMSGKFDGTWNSSVGLATKDDLTKSIDFRGNAKMFKVRSGTDGLKNIYLDIEDESGNTCSLAFLSDGENTVKLILNGKTVWTK